MGIFSFFKREKIDKTFINELSVQAIEAGANCAKYLYVPQKGSSLLEIHLEFLHFFLHIISRICLYKHGAEKRKKLFLFLIPMTFKNMLEIVAHDRNFSAKTKKAMYKGFVETYLANDVIYSLCTEYVPKNPLDRAALFSKVSERALITAKYPSDIIDFNEMIIEVTYNEFKNRSWEAYIDMAVEKI